MLAVLLQDSYSFVRSTAPAVAYDSKQYYQQPTATAAVAAAAAQPQPTVAESYYQTGTLSTSWETTWKKTIQGQYIFLRLLSHSTLNKMSENDDDYDDNFLMFR